MAMVRLFRLLLLNLERDRSMVSWNIQSPQRWLRPLLHPSGLAGLISVGIHGSLFAASPTFSNLNLFAVAEPDLLLENREVALIELTPAEQQRLPDFSQSFYNFATSDDFGTFGDLGIANPLFQGEENTENSNVSKSNPSQRRNTSSGKSVVDTIILGNLESSQANNPAATPPTLPSLPLVELTPGNTPNESSQLSEAELNSDDAEPPNLGEQDASDGSAIALGESSAADLESAPSNPLSESPTSDEVIIAVSGNPMDGMTLEEQLQAYRYDSRNILEGEDELDIQIANWLQQGSELAEKLQTPVGNFTGIPEASAQLELNHDRCLSTDPHLGLIGAWVGPQGKLLREPEVLKSTGYLAFNRHAGQFVESWDFSSVNQLTAYRFEVVVNYDSETCVPPGQALGNPQNPDDGQSEAASSEETATSETETGSSETEIVQDSKAAPDSTITPE